MGYSNWKSLLIQEVPIICSLKLGEISHGWCGNCYQSQIIRKAGVMSIVLVGGEVAPDDRIRVEIPPEPHIPLDRV